MAAGWAAGVGLVVLLTVTAIGWAAAPHGAFDQDVDGVLRTAVQMWLVGHLVGFGIPGGQVGMLPLGLVVLPGLVLYRSGRWLARSCELPRLRHLFRAALAIAGPYAAISGTLALIGQTEAIRPSVVQALLAGFALAFAAGGMGVLHQLLKDKGIPKRRLLEVMPERPRSLLAGTLGATGTLLVAGALLVAVPLALNHGEAAAITHQLSPGIIGGILLILLQLLYLPNAVVFGTAYAIGPGFALGSGTMVAPTGITVGALPLFPMLAALPDNGPAPAISLVALAAPFAAGIVGGILTQRSAPTLVGEAAPLWGFVCGVSTGLVLAALSLIAGGSLGADRLAVVGPSAWQVGVITALEVGVAAAITAWLANWRYLRRIRAAEGEDGQRPHAGPPPGAERADAVTEPRAASSDTGASDTAPADAPTADAAPTLTLIRTDPDTYYVEDRGAADPVDEPETGTGGATRPRRRIALPTWRPRLPHWGRGRGRTGGKGSGATEPDDAEELYGITYEVDPDDGAPPEAETEAGTAEHSVGRRPDGPGSGHRDR
nr:DUF6350 family protein [Nocardiopsis mwathae]